MGIPSHWISVWNKEIFIIATGGKTFRSLSKLLCQKVLLSWCFDLVNPASLKMLSQTGPGWVALSTAWSSVWGQSESCVRRASPQLLRFRLCSLTGVCVSAPCQWTRTTSASLSPRVLMGLKAAPLLTSLADTEALPHAGKMLWAAVMNIVSFSLVASTGCQPVCCWKWR